MKNFRDFKVWEKAHEFVLETYRLNPKGWIGAEEQLNLANCRVPVASCLIFSPATR
jgi:hypothetical protein